MIMLTVVVRPGCERHHTPPRSPCRVLPWFFLTVVYHEEPRLVF
jgi:hypothetical protein